VSEAETRQELRYSLARARVLVCVEGSILLFLGAAAIVLPGLAAIAVTILLGWLFLFSGLIGLVVALASRQLHGTRWSIVSAIVAICAGFALMVWPIENVRLLMVLLGLFFAADGIFSLLYALDHRRSLTGRWAWMLASAIVTLLFAAFILSGFPISAALLGTLVGVDLVFAGAALVAIGTGLKIPA
jgi:uncharacterized membrane protein HdeD (DUF308 family)